MHQPSLLQPREAFVRESVSTLKSMGNDVVDNIGAFVAGATAVGLSAGSALGMAAMHFTPQAQSVSAGIESFVASGVLGGTVFLVAKIHKDGLTPSMRAARSKASERRALALLFSHDRSA